MAKILVSDDDPQVLGLVAAVLEMAGHEVETTSDPRAVLHLAGRGADAIVLDVMMPGVSGYQVLNELRSSPATATIPILFLSGLGEGADRVRGLQQGADDYLVKPFEPDELILRVGRLVSKKSAAEATPRAALVSLRGEPEDSPAGRCFGRYAVQEVIGEGAMGTVYRGWDPRLQRAVALKTVRYDPATSELQRKELFERLKNEAVTVARFSHPNIIAVYDMGDAGGMAFVAMELIDGLSLADHLAGPRALPPERVVPLGAQIAAALAAAHAREVIHRDVKPNNVLLGRDGTVKVTDFGLAYVVSAMSASSASHLSGTPGYVPPEVLHDEPYTAAGDLFGFGASLYEALAGRHPFVGRTLKDTILNTMEGIARPLADVAPEVPGDLAGLVMSLLDVEPRSRPAAAAVQSILDRTATENGWRWGAEGLPAAG